MRPKNHWHLVMVVALVGLGGLIAACGGDEEPAATSTAAPTMSMPASSSPAATTTAASTSPISIAGVWARSTPGNPNETSAVYAVISNSGAADKLLSASVDASIAKTVETHRTVRVGDSMKMEPIPGWDVPANGKLTLEPGGNHIMLLNLTKALKAGEQFPVTLKFEKAGTIVVQAEVRTATGEPVAPGGMGTPGAMGGSATPTMMPGR